MFTVIGGDIIIMVAAMSARITSTTISRKEEDRTDENTQHG